MNSLTTIVKDKLLAEGACLVGIGDLTELPAQVRCGLPIGISVVVKFPAEVIRGISDLPTREYYEWYQRLNEQLDALVSLGAGILQEHGYEAIAQTRAQVGSFEGDNNNSVLPHKTVATRAGIGWIGKSALLVTEQFGSMVRLSSILTNAPLSTDEPINTSKCGACLICTEACPGNAISGRQWQLGLYRDEFFDPVKCRSTARERSQIGFGEAATICGKCIEVCPHTRQAMA